MVLIKKIWVYVLCLGLLNVSVKAMEETSECSSIISTLPLEILEHILHYVLEYAPRDVLTLPLVSNDFKNALTQKQIIPALAKVLALPERAAALKEIKRKSLSAQQAAQLLALYPADNNLTLKIIAAAKNNNFEEVKKLVHNNADVNAYYASYDPKHNLTLNSPLYNAIIGYDHHISRYQESAANKIRVVTLLLKAGADPNALTDPLPSLVVASREGLITIIELLIKAGAWVNKGRVLPLTEALIHEKHLAFNKLFQLGASVNDKDDFHMTPLMSIMVHKYLNTEKREKYKNILLSHGASLTPKDCFAPTFLYKIPYDTFCNLVRSGIINPKLKDEENNTLLHYVECNGNVAQLACLIKAGTDIHARNNQGKTPLMMVKDLSSAQLLLKAGADIHAQDNEGRTALLLAVIRGDYNMVEFLLQQGADVNVCDKYNKPASVYAEAGSLRGILMLLIEKKAKLTLKTSLFFYTMRNNSEMVEHVIKAGVNVNSTSLLATIKGTTPLMVAAHLGYTHLVTLLLEAGAHIHARNSIGNTALTYATMGNHGAIKELLIKAQDRHDQKQKVQGTKRKEAPAE